MMSYTNTSLEAYLGVDINARQDEVLSVLRRSEDATCGELAQALKTRISSVSPRITELRKHGLIYDTGKRRKDPESGRNQKVYAITPGIKGSS